MVAMRSVVSSSGLRRLMEGGGRSSVSGLRYFSDDKGRILSEEERAKETVYIQKMERERMEKARQKAEKERAEREKTDKECNLPSFLSSNSRGCASEEKIQEVLQATIMNFCVWDPRIDFKFWALTGYAANVELLQLQGCSGKFCLIAYSKAMTRVWDPGESWCVNSSSRRRAIRCSSFAYVTAQTEQICSSYTHRFKGVMTVVMLVFKGHKMGAQTIQPWSPQSLLKSSFFALPLNFLAQVARSVEIAKALDFNGLIIIGGADFDTNAHRLVAYFSIKMQPATVALASIDEILGTPLSGTNTYVLAYFVNLSFDQGSIDAKEEWGEKGIADYVSHIQKIILVANNAWPGGGTTPNDLLKKKRNVLMTTYYEDVAATLQDVDIHYVTCLRNHVDGESLIMDLKTLYYGYSLSANDNNGL